MKKANLPYFCVHEEFVSFACGESAEVSLDDDDGGPVSQHRIHALERPAYTPHLVFIRR